MNEEARISSTSAAQPSRGTAPGTAPETHQRYHHQHHLQRRRRRTPLQWPSNRTHAETAAGRTTPRHHPRTPNHHRSSLRFHPTGPARRAPRSPHRARPASDTSEPRAPRPASKTDDRSATPILQRLRRTPTACTPAQGSGAALRGAQTYSCVHARGPARASRRGKASVHRRCLRGSNHAGTGCATPRTPPTSTWKHPSHHHAKRSTLPRAPAPRNTRSPFSWSP
eukprot:6213144-Pleurochrysis_carterae.AAC.1